MDQDDKLVEGCKAGSQQAQIAVYRKYYHPVYNTCLRIVNNPADAEDLMQNSFIDAFSRIKACRFTAAFSGWLRKIAVNNCLDFLAKRKRSGEVNETMVDIPDLSDADEQEFIEFRVEQVKRVMKSLNDDYRIILSLYLFEGYDYEEIGQILKISQQNARTRISRAKQALINMIPQHYNILNNASNNGGRIK